MTEILFTPTRLGAVDMANRIVMAPMTRSRASDGDVPGPMVAEYYRQRAGAGLIVTEGTQPSPEGKGYWQTPGIHSAEQIAGWAKVTAAVHAEGGKIAIQLMHCGRAVVAANRGFAADIIAPSAIPLDGAIPGPDGTPVATDAPRAMDKNDIRRVIDEHAQAARNAHEAGFDAVELHCASGYLMNQFLDPVANQRTDEWGGSAEARARFPAEVIGAMAAAIGNDRVGFRISPGNPYNGMVTNDPEPTFAAFLRAASMHRPAFVHVVDVSPPGLDTLAMVRANFDGPIIANNGLDAKSGAALIDNGRAEAVSFGRAWISNPDLVARIKSGAALAKADRATSYGGGEAGFTDYPAMSG